MLESRKPRHIRDIAHLYISRPRPPAQAPAASVWITAEHQRLFPGFHVANLAAALSVKNCPLRLLDRSGLLPNAGYFMSLPARRYLRWGEEGAGPAAGLGGVEIDCSPRESRLTPHVSRPVRVELVHLPPLSSEGRLEEALREAKRRAAPVNVLVVLKTGRPLREGALSTVTAAIDPAATFVFHLVESPFDRPGDTSGALPEGWDAIELGRLVDWERVIDDRVPTVVRAPNSSLSQTFRSASEALLFKINDLGRKADAPRTFGISAGTGSRMRHR